MEGETPAAVVMEGGNQPPPAKMEGENKPPPAEVEGEAQPLPACVSKVLDDDNLLAEIIVRFGFPTSLVRAATACRRWLRLASDRAFLRRFRKLHPPRLLGFYLAQRVYPDAATRFFPMLPQPSELDTVIARASFSLDTNKGERTDMAGCWNGRVVTSSYLCHHHHDELRGEVTFVVHSPLCSERGTAVIPRLRFLEISFWGYRQLFSREEGDGVSYFYVMVDSTPEGKSVVQVYMLRNGDDAWRTHFNLTVGYLIHARPRPNSLLVDNKVYIASACNKIIVLDLTASSFSTIQLPQGVGFRTIGTTMISRADEPSAIYLIHAKELRLHVWLHKGGNWLLVDNICLREMCAHLLEDEPSALLQINHVGDYTGEFLFLEMGRYALYLDVKCRTLGKVYQKIKEDHYFGRIYPFMMIWPPIFPMVKDGPARFAPLPFDDLYSALVEVT